MIRILFLSFLFCLSINSYAQTSWVGVSTGLSYYIGDQQRSIIDLDGNALDGIPYFLSISTGYDYDVWGLLGGYIYADYPAIHPDSTKRQTIYVSGKRKLSTHWYVTSGWAFTVGGYTSSTGPILSIGVNLPTSNHHTFYFETTSFFSWPDRTIDGIKDQGGGWTDKLIQFGIGSRWIIE